MSLINDALRRKNEEKKVTPPEKSEGAPMQAVHPPHQSSSLLKPILIVVIALMLVVAALLFWLGWKTKNELAKITQSQTPVQSSPIAPVENNNVIPTVATTPSNATLIATPASTNADTSVVESVTNAATIPAVIVPAPLKLQGIFFRPSNPTAMINGKTVSVDEMVSGARVIKIERQKVTLERDGKIETLTMD